MSSTAPAETVCAKKKFADLKPWQKVLVCTLASVQISLAATAWVDLARRPAEEVDGSKLKWALIIAVNFVGPLSYFRTGRRN
ncbi:MULTISPECIES: PLDc N-terminal domain-containing protein [unclassified Rhodococcus (in: high G+C Gram-positive bacteria)]|uniref:PLDc N-terminal domain-containing protein n=1 Tax=Rhodococcus sp. SJ-3 TaxID=3454628 RepID=UPI003F7A314F